MANEKKLYRSRDPLLSGVCAGIAEYFNIDPIIVRILTVVLTLATGGLLVIGYLVLWAIVPAAPDPNSPVDVHPEEVHSETYGDVTNKIPRQEATTARSASAAGAAAQAARAYTGYNVSAGAAHVPPPPPQSYGPAGTTQPLDPDKAGGPAAAGVPSDGQPQATQVTQAGPAVQPPPPTAAPQSSKAGQRSTGGALWFGFVLLFVGLMALFGTFVHGVAWWQFWPLIFVIAGIGQMIVPARPGHRMHRFVNGMMQFAFGVSALYMSLGVVSVWSLQPIFTNLWPILLIMCGFFVLGSTLKNPLLTLCGGLCFVAFCVIGLGWFSYPGTTDIITFSGPFGNVYSLDINPWV